MKWCQQVFLLTFLTGMLSACSWFGESEAQKQLREGSSRPVIIPDGLDKPEFVDIMPIPEVIDSRGLSGKEYKVGLPEALSTSFGVEQIVIKKLGDDRWVFLDLPPATVWPKVVQFWEANNLAVESADPGSGVLTSQWLPARDGTVDEIYESLVGGNVFSNTTGVTSYKFQLKVEPGIRSGSTEIYLREREIPEGAPFRLDQIEWDAPSDNLELETRILTELAYYLGRTVNQGSISLLATGLRASRAELVPDRVRPVLKYKLDFARAWATVGNALENARVKVEDIDRSSANYYVYYTTDHQPEPGFLKRIFSRGSKLESGPANRYSVHLEPVGKEVHVTVMKGDSSPAEALVAERLLKIVKEYST